MVNAGSIIGGAFRVLRHQPRVFGAWAAACISLTIGTGLATRPMMAAMAADPPDGFGTYVLRMLPFQLALLLLMLVMFNAAQRAVLRPSEEEPFAYFRLGMDELRIFLLALVLTIIVYLGMAVAMGVAVAVVAALAAAVGLAASALATALVVLLLVGFVIWLEVRLSLAFPLTLIRRKIIIGESWRVTRGRFWTLFGAYLIIAMILFAVTIIVSAATSGSYWVDLVRSGLRPEQMQQAAQAQLARQLGPVDGMAVLGFILGGLNTTLMIALSGGAVAGAARDMDVDADAIAETFA